jgi:adenylate kinase
MQMKAIVVSGTPGTGKTRLAKALAKNKNYEYVDVNKLIKEKKLYDSYDRKRKCNVVDIKKLNKFLIRLIGESKKKLVIDSHLSHYLPKKYVEFCIITKCNLKKLKKRLEKRGYSKSKVRENLDSEIFDICLNEAKEMGHKIKTIKT